MKRATCLLVLLSLVLSVPVFANSGVCGKETADKKVERLQQKLGLSTEQTAKVRSIFEAKGEKIKALMEQTQAEIGAVLTPEQKTKYEAIKKEGGHKTGRKHHGND